MAQKLITAILPTDVDALRIIRRLKDEQAIPSANLNFARGVGRMMRGRSLTSESSQREILSVVVPEARADALFAWLFEAADIDRPHGGILYMQTLAEATAYTLPDLPAEAGESVS